MKRHRFGVVFAAAVLLIPSPGSSEVDAAAAEWQALTFCATVGWPYGHLDRQVERSDVGWDHDWRVELVSVRPPNPDQDEPLAELVCAEVLVDRATGEVRFADDRTPIPAGEPKLSPAAAREVAERFFRLFGVGRDCVFHRQEDEGEERFFQWRRDVQGIPYEYGGVNIWLSPAGRLRSFGRDFTMPMPVLIAVNIGPQQAAAAALAAGRAAGHDERNLVPEGPPFLEVVGVVDDDELTTPTHVAWTVPLSGCIMHIDAATGATGSIYSGERTCLPFILEGAWPGTGTVPTDSGGLPPWVTSAGVLLAAVWVARRLHRRRVG